MGSFTRSQLGFLTEEEDVSEAVPQDMNKSLLGKGKYLSPEMQPNL
jgi:hypothetical protein